MGLKNDVTGVNSERTDEKVSKGRRALNAALVIGLKPGGISIKACCLIYWTIVIPIITFASQLWILNEYDIKALDHFQKYAGRRIQRFHVKSPSETRTTG